jgi:hypothetical protein
LRIIFPLRGLAQPPGHGSARNQIQESQEGAG